MKFTEKRQEDRKRRGGRRGYEDCYHEVSERVKSKEKPIEGGQEKRRSDKEKYGIK